MKTALVLFLIPIAFLRSTETPVIYEAGKITPIFASGVAGRPFLNQSEVSITLTQEQRLEIRVIQAELKAARAEIRALEARLALLVHEARDEVRAPKTWKFDPDSMRFQKPNMEKKP